MSIEGERVALVIAPPLFAGIEQYAAGPAAPLILQKEALCSKVLAKVDTETWAPRLVEAGLGVGDNERMALNHARDLATAAVVDFMDLHALAWYISELHNMSESEFADALRNSKQTLLKVSNIGNISKELILAAAFNPAFAPGSFNLTITSDEVVQVTTGPNGETCFSWHSEFQALIDRFTTDYSGCPANRVVITTPDGRRRKLMNYFWDRMIDTLYPPKMAETLGLEGEVAAE